MSYAGLRPNTAQPLSDSKDELHSGTTIQRIEIRYYPLVRAALVWQSPARAQPL